MCMQRTACDTLHGYQLERPVPNTPRVTAWNELDEHNRALMHFNY